MDWIVSWRWGSINECLPQWLDRNCYVQRLYQLLGGEVIAGVATGFIRCLYSFPVALQNAGLEWTFHAFLSVLSLQKVTS